MTIRVRKNCVSVKRFDPALYASENTRVHVHRSRNKIINIRTNFVLPLKTLGVTSM